MEDKDIVTLYWARSEEAIRATAAKYGAYCAAIIRRLLGDGRDSEECLNDTWLGAWNAMPPQRPVRLPPFLGRIARNTALDRYDYNTAQCRGALPAALEELGLRIPADVGVLTFDDYPFSRLTSPELTVVDIDVRDMGAQAAKLLTDCIRRPNLQTQSYTTASNLIVRASTRRR